MSYILDALKQSDRSRQINTTHELSQSSMQPATSNENKWLKIAVVALALITTATLAYSFLSGDKESNVVTPIDAQVQQVPQQVQQQAPQQTQQVTTQSRPVVNQAVTTQTAPPPVQQTTPQPQPNNTPTQRSSLSELSQTETAPVVIQQAAPVVTAPVNTNTTSAGSDSYENQSGDFTGYDNYRSLKSKYNLPELHLDILMYHPELPKRKAYINMAMYSQGESTNEGAEVMKIGKEGVLLRYSGHDFVLTAK